LGRAEPAAFNTRFPLRPYCAVRANFFASRETQTITADVVIGQMRMPPGDNIKDD
jgi:hypothetical protein